MSDGKKVLAWMNQGLEAQAAAANAMNAERQAALRDRGAASQADHKQEAARQATTQTVNVPEQSTATAQEQSPTPKGLAPDQRPELGASAAHDTPAPQKAAGMTREQIAQELGVPQAVEGKGLAPEDRPAFNHQDRARAFIGEHGMAFDAAKKEVAGRDGARPDFSNEGTAGVVQDPTDRPDFKNRPQIDIAQQAHERGLDRNSNDLGY